MRRTAIGLCLAAAFAVVASLGAQTGTSTQPYRSSMIDRDSINVTGCLQKDASGAFILANAQIEPSAGRPGSASSSSSSSTGTTGGSATGTSGSTSTSSGS